MGNQGVDPQRCGEEMEFFQGEGNVLGVSQGVFPDGVDTASLHPLDEELDRVLFDGIGRLDICVKSRCIAWNCCQCGLGESSRWNV